MIRRRPHMPKRRYRRLTVRVQVVYTSDAGTRSAVATTLGAGGLFVDEGESLPKGSPLSLQFRLPGSDELWKLDARVAWSDATGMGVEFVDRSAIAGLAVALDSWSGSD